MGAISGVKLNMPGLIAISNEVNGTVCRELAEKAKAAMESDARTFAVSGDYAESFEITSDQRTGADDFAHTYVYSTSPYALQVEARHGTMARGLGSV